MTPSEEMDPCPAPEEAGRHDTLKYSLLGPSLTKAGQDSVDQQKVRTLSTSSVLLLATKKIFQVSEIIYNASKGSKYFHNEETRDKNLTEKIEKILKKKGQLEQLDLAHVRRKADEHIAELELSRDLSQTIVHIDCDAFYAACEELDRPELKDLPFSVGKGVLTTCNYHARTFGCRSGMAGFVAKKLCPQLIQVSMRGGCCIYLSCAEVRARSSWNGKIVNPSHLWDRHWLMKESYTFLERRNSSVRLDLSQENTLIIRNVLLGLV